MGLPLNYMESALSFGDGQAGYKGRFDKAIGEMQFNRNQTLVKRGEFRVRGDAFEICPASGDDLNYRIEIENQK